jgi:D-alanyl-D-alanine carboxypeptidase/D-alanyl-D-alanine-endopeptidase (penicillin-binding protein 4)
MKARADWRQPFLKQARVFISAVCMLVFSCLAIQPFLAPGVGDDFSTRDFSKITALLGAQDAAMVASPGGKVLFAHNPDVERIPASTIKLLTALAAFHYLQTDFRFTTEFFMDTHANLKIKGQGDPLLISEVVSDIAVALAIELKGPDRRFDHLFLDNTYFASPVTIPGVSGSSEPYDAPIGALCVNFNTVNFRQANKTFVSAEPQTPLLPMVLPHIKASGLNEGRITLSHQQDEITYYAGHLFRHFLEEAGFEFSGRVGIEPVSLQDHLVLAYHSRFTLDQIVARMLEYSNNFMANQVFIHMGAQQYGTPGTLEKAARAAQAYARSELGLQHVAIAEGSGISRANRITARDMLTVLTAFEPHHALMKRNGRLYYKTGHLKGIRTQVGYYQDPEKGLHPYVILLNTPGKSMHPVVKKLLQAFEHGN